MLHVPSSQIFSRSITAQQMRAIVAADSHLLDGDSWDAVAAEFGVRTTDMLAFALKMEVQATLDDPSEQEHRELILLGQQKLADTTILCIGNPRTGKSTFLNGLATALSLYPVEADEEKLEAKLDDLVPEPELEAEREDVRAGTPVVDNWLVSCHSL